jgi:hypothetical protein
MGRCSGSTQGRHHRVGEHWRRCGDRVLRAFEQTDVDRASAREKRRARRGFRIRQGPRVTVLVPVILGIALLGCAAELVETAVGAPGLRVEARRAGHRQHVPVAAAFRTLFGWASPAAGLEPCDPARCGRRFHRRLSRRGHLRRRMRRGQRIGHCHYSS